jgi:hypothetical protein
MRRMRFSPLQSIETRDVTGDRPLITLVVQFQFPAAAKEEISLADRCKVEGIRGMTFYLEPQIGDTLEFGGYLWKVVGRLIRPNEYRKHGRRILPVIDTQYLGACPEDSL